MAKLLPEEFSQASTPAVSGGLPPLLPSFSLFLIPLLPLLHEMRFLCIVPYVHRFAYLSNNVFPRKGSRDAYLPECRRTRGKVSRICGVVNVLMRKLEATPRLKARLRSGCANSCKANLQNFSPRNLKFSSSDSLSNFPSYPPRRSSNLSHKRGELHAWKACFAQVRGNLSSRFAPPPSRRSLNSLSLSLS